MLWIISLTRVLLNLTPVSLFSCIPFQPSLSLVFSLGTSSCAFGLRGGPLSCDLAHPSAHTHKHTHTHTHTHTHSESALGAQMHLEDTYSIILSALTAHSDCAHLLWHTHHTAQMHRGNYELHILFSFFFNTQQSLVHTRSQSATDTSRHSLRTFLHTLQTESQPLCNPAQSNPLRDQSSQNFPTCPRSFFFFFLVSALLPLRGGSCPLTLILELALRTQLTQKVLSRNELAQWTSFHGRCVTEQVELESYGVMEGLVKKDSLWDGDVCL